MKRSVLLLVVATVLFPALAGANGSGIEPSPMAQYLVELANRARADPDAEAAFFEIDLNEGLAPGTLPSGPRQPLAIHKDLTEISLWQTMDIINNIGDLSPDHSSSDGTTFSQRMASTGISYSGASENNAWSSQGGKALSSGTVDKMHMLLFKDFTKTVDIAGRGHRKNMLNGDRNLIGPSAVLGKILGRGAGVCTQDLMTVPQTYITGVVFSDWVSADSFYTPEEGWWGVTITANPGGYQTMTFGSGGYSLPVPDGTYTVTASGGGLPAPIPVSNVTVSGQNVKVDFLPPANLVPPPLAEITHLKGAAKQGKDGGWLFAAKKGTFSPGAWSFTQAQADGVYVELDGTNYFQGADRLKTKYKLDKVTGDIVGISVQDANKNKLALNLAKKTFKVAWKAAPGFDPTDGTVQLRIGWPDGRGTLQIPVTIVDTKGVAGPATGFFEYP